MAKTVTRKLGAASSIAVTVTKPRDAVLVRVSTAVEAHDTNAEQVESTIVVSRDVSTDWLVEREIWTSAQRTAFHSCLNALRTGLARQFPLTRNGGDVEDDLE